MHTRRGARIPLPFLPRPSVGSVSDHVPCSAKGRPTFGFPELSAAARQDGDIRMGISEMNRHHRPETRRGTPSPISATRGTSALSPASTPAHFLPDDSRENHGPRTVCTGPDLVRMHAAIDEYLAPYRLSLPDDGPFFGSLSATRSGDVVIAELRCDAPLQAEIESMPDSAYHVTLAGRGCEVEVDGGPARTGSHVIGPGQRVRVRWPVGEPVTVVRLSRRLVERVWRDQGGRPLTAPLRFTVPLSPAAAQSRIWETFAAAFIASRDCGLLAGPASAGTRFGQLLAQALLNLQPHARPQAVPDRPVPVPHRAGAAEDNGVMAVPAPVLRALDFCREHVHEPLAVADIAAAGGMSVRRLQAAFRIHVGTSPVEYVKRIRLAGVHADLQRIAAGSRHETVTDVALRWGFTHLGRFSGAYRAEFGRLPSQTAKSAPPDPV